MIRHDKTSHDFALDDMTLHDFRHVSFCFHLIPHTLRIDYDARSLGAMIETPGFVGSNNVFQVEPLCFLLKAGMERLRPKLGTAPTGIVGAPLIRADKNMSCEGRHEWFLLGLHCGGLHPVNQLCHISCGQEWGAPSRSGENRRNLSQP